MLTAQCSQVCGAPMGGEEVGARVILLRASLATLRCILGSARLMVRSAWRFSIEDEGCVSRGELATGGWAHSKQADCHRTTQLIIEVLLELELGVVGG